MTKADICFVLIQVIAVCLLVLLILRGVCAFCYKQGQVDYANGIIMYEPLKNPAGLVVEWRLKEYESQKD